MKGGAKMATRLAQVNKSKRNRSGKGWMLALLVLLALSVAMLAGCQSLNSPSDYGNPTSNPTLEKNVAWEMTPAGVYAPRYYPTH
jgi:uncharacterized lipoprotein